MKSVILHRHSLISILICISLIGGQSFAQTCTFTGGGNGTSWTQGSNWSCGSEPDPSSQNVVIPVGFNVINNGTSDFGFENGYDLTINGSLDMNNKKIEMKSSGSFLTIGPSGNLFDINELFFNSNADGLINGALDVNHLKTDDDTELTVNTRCIDVTNKLENLSSSGILGSGCIDYTGSSGDFANSGSDGIFGCTDNNVNNCSLDGGALPVELVRFIVSADDDFVALEWTTASEENFDYFSIERSEDGEGFYEIGTVAGHGDSQTPINYSFEDIDPIFGISYYRLNAIDYDGKSFKEWPLQSAIKKQLVSRGAADALKLWQQGLGKAKKKKVGEAVNKFNEALEINPGFGHCLIDLAHCYIHANEPEKAIKTLIRANDSTPVYPPVFFNLGIALAAQGDKKHCIMAYNKAIKLDREYANAYLNRAIVFLNHRHLRLAERDLELIKDTISDDPELHYNLACLYALKKEVERSLKHLQRALELGFAEKQMIAADAHLEAIRNHPLYIHLKKKYKLS